MLRALTALAAASGAAAIAAPVAQHATQLLQTWDKELDHASAGAKDTPVTRVVGLLQNMMKELQRDMEQDESQYKELSCWCSNNTYEKSEAVKASEAKIDELGSKIESLTAHSSELASSIEELNAEYAADKKALDEATALREKQVAEFHGMEKDSIQALENLKAAIKVLAKHQGPENAPDSSVAGGAVFKTERDSWSSLLATGAKGFPWALSREDRDARSLDNFMRTSGLDDTDTRSVVPSPAAGERPVARHGFLQQKGKQGDASHAGLSEDEAAIVRVAMKTASAFMQAHQGYFPAYNAQSGEIYGVLQQLKEQMEGELSEAQKLEQERAAAFAELRSAKEAELANGYKMSEQKEDQKAQTDNDLAEAKEDLDQEKAIFGEDQLFLKNLGETCADASKNFDARKQQRLLEMQAVTETISILQQDEARDAMSSTYNAPSFAQLSSRGGGARAAAAQVLRRQAKASRSPQLSILATSVELDSFTRVKEAIDKMIAMLKQQQADEVKHTDWCKDELHENEMSTAKHTDKREDIEANLAELVSAIQGHDDAIAAAKAEIASLQLNLQRASEDRKAENLDFQRTVADQTVTVEVLKKALDRLATYYDLAQTGAAGAARRQTPPVAQMEYAPNKGSSGAMEMIEKLIHEAESLRAESRKGESQAQAAYEQTIADTNASVEAQQREVTTRSHARAQAMKDKLLAESDHADTVKELDGLAKYNSELHASCDFHLKNFEVRQSGRQAEIEALQQAKQILSGAALS